MKYMTARWRGTHEQAPNEIVLDLDGGCRSAIGIKIELTFLNPILHVAAGALHESSINRCGTTIFADSSPRCTQFGERSALDPAIQCAVRLRRRARAFA